MALVVGNGYSRDQIVRELGVSGDQRDRAVLLSGNTVAAIVIKQNGVNPFNGKTYANALTAKSLIMQGENDDRGHRLENTNVTVRLFFSTKNDGLFRYEGAVRYTGQMSVPGEPIRQFERVP
ncbi:MAG: hypothetical protein AB7O24_06170 [Kofleriaceae bacterium]